MQRTRTWLLLGAGALLLGHQAAAQNSGIKITKDRALSTTPTETNTIPTATTTTVASGDVVTTAITTTPFSLASYANMTEGNIVAHMATGDSLEIELASLGQLKATDQRVRNYAAMLATAHQAHLVNTLKMVTEEHIPPAPMAVDPEANRLRETINSLRSLSSGATWDAAFLRFNYTHHQNELDLINVNVKNAHDDDLEDHIEDTQKSLTNHRDTAASIATALGVSLP